MGISLSDKIDITLYDDMKNAYKSNYDDAYTESEMVNIIPAKKNMIKAIIPDKLKYLKDLYLKYRLFKINPTTGKKSNRPAKANEIRGSMPYLAKELGILQPSVVITLGNVPLKAVTGQNEITIGKIHGCVVETDGMKIFPI